MCSYGIPVSGTMAEIFLKYIENRHLKQLLDSKNITFDMWMSYL